MELGSEYNLTLSELNIVSDNIIEYLSEFQYCIYFDSGRSALKHLSQSLSSFSKILLPEFICESVINSFDKGKTEFYKLKNDFSVDIESLEEQIGNEKSVIFLMHYFGSLQSSEVLIKLRLIADHSGSIIIEDTTHSIFTKKATIGDYVVCSIRKWLPIAGGGVLYYNKNILKIDELEYCKNKDNNRSYGMILKDLFLNKGFECNREYRQIFSESEARLDEQCEIYQISDFSKFIASCMSVEKIIEQRRHNFQQLDVEMKKSGLKSVVELDRIGVPLAYVLRVKGRDNFRKYLMNKKIYCAVHWPFDNHKPEQRPFAIRNAGELISLPIDQRYDKEAMYYLIDAIHGYGGDLLF